MNAYELGVVEEIKEWKNGSDSKTTKILSKITTPISWVFEKAFSNVVGITISKAILGFMELLKDTVYWLYSEKRILKKARKLGLEVNSIEQLTECSLEKLDTLAHKHFRFNIWMAAFEGAITGFGGLFLIAADIPMLFGISFKVIQQVGSCYGFKMDEPRMSMKVFSCLTIASATSAQAKSLALADMAITTEALVKEWTYKKIAETTNTGTLVQALKNMTKRMPQKIAKNVTQKKLGQALPIVGGFVGAGFNYWFVNNVTTSAQMIFRELYLSRKYDNQDFVEYKEQEDS